MRQPPIVRPLIALAVVASMVLAGCGGSDTGQPAASVGDPASAASAVPTTAPVTEVPTTAPATVLPTSPATAEPSPTVPTPTATATATSTPTPTPTPEPDFDCFLEANAPGPVSSLDIAVDVVASGLEVPWGLAVLPNGDLLISERPGRLRLIEQGVLVEEPVLEPQVELPPPLFGVDTLGPEGGLLGVLLHPDFADNRQFYIFFNQRPEPDRYSGRIERYVLADDGRSATLDRVIIEDLPAGVHHQGGRMRIGPDGMLYVGVGAFEPAEAQDPTTLAGKLLRLDLDGQIPPDNPDANSYIFISGIRNSQGYDWFDDDTLVIVDHGPSGLELDMPNLRGFDEVNVARAGDNLGWPLVWGCDEAPDTLSPVLTWSASVPPTGATFYRDLDIAELSGRFLFTTVGRDFGQHLHSVELDPSDPYLLVSHEVHLLGQYGRLRTVVPDGAGGLFMMTSNCDGRGVCPSSRDLILRITAAG